MIYNIINHIKKSHSTILKRQTLFGNDFLKSVSFTTPFSIQYFLIQGCNCTHTVHQPAQILCKKCHSTILKRQTLFFKTDFFHNSIFHPIFLSSRLQWYTHNPSTDPNFASLVSLQPQGKVSIVSYESPPYMTFCHSLLRRYGTLQFLSFKRKK